MPLAVWTSNHFKVHFNCSKQVNAHSELIALDASDLGAAIE